MKLISTLFTLTLLTSFNAVADETPKTITLKAVMQQLVSNYNTLNYAILMEDFSTIEAAAHNISDHDKPDLSQRKKIMKGLKAGMAGFKQADSKVHDLAVQIEEAAKAKNMSLLIEQQAKMLNACMNCHTQYREEVTKLLK